MVDECLVVTILPLMISQLISPNYEGDDMVDAENRSLSRRAAHLPDFANSCQNCAVWTGRALPSSLSSIYRADGTVVAKRHPLAS
jgi:hypothetical protein